MARLIGRGGSGPTNEGERRVIERLLHDLPQRYAVAPNVEVAEPGGLHSEYDAIVVAPHTVYVVEIKDWRGQITGDDREWLVNGDSRKSPLLATERKARVLKSKLVGRMQALSRVWVEPVVALASVPARLNLPAEIRRRVLLPDELTRFLTDPNAVRQRPDAIADLTGHVERAISADVRPRSRPRSFGAYDVIEQLEQTADEAIYRARHRLLRGAPPVRLRVVTLSPYALSPAQLEARRGALLRETEALLAMGSHPNVVAARDVIQDDDRIVLVLDDAEGRSLRQRMHNGTPMTVQERLDVLADVCRALVHAHAHRVIHRRVEPESVLLGEDGTTRLGRFSLAKLLGSDGATVWTEDALAELDRRYLAPELADPSHGAPSPTTDLYGLGCIAYELFAGQAPFSDPREAFGPVPALPRGTPQGLGELVETLLRGDPARRAQDARETLAAVDALRTAERPRTTTNGPKEHYEPGDVIDGKFEVKGGLGGGGFSTVYRVYWSMDDREYALKVFNHNASFDKVQREITILRQIEHPHVVRAVWADQTRAGQWYLVTELITGESLEDYTYGRKQLSAARAVDVTCDLLRALEAIHPDEQRIAALEEKGHSGELSAEEYDELQRLKSRGIVHRDIKPQNLILSDDGVVLIDFNIASPYGGRVDTLSGTPRYQCPDIHRGLDRWDVAQDLFATGVVLYELLCAEHPYENEQPRVDRTPRDPRTFRPDLSAELAAFLLRACAPRKLELFHSAREMRLALEAIEPLVEVMRADGVTSLPARLQALLAAAPPNVNPMVEEFLALASQARRTNSGTRGLDEVAKATYVATRLDERLSKAVLEGRHALVIVTGNAGDGKTAFIQQVEAAAKRAGAMELQATPNGRRLSYAGQEVVTLYDGSQDEGDKRSDDLLREFLRPFAAGASGPTGVRLAAINEGRLKDFLLDHREQYPRLAVRVLDQLEHPEAPPQDDEVVVVNLNLRSVTLGEEESIFSRQLRRIVDDPFWGPCEACDYRTRCPLKHNVDTFRSSPDSDSGKQAAERLHTLVDLVRLRRRRHLTMRDVRSLISHILFRDRTCYEVPGILESGDPFDVIDVSYFQGPGGQGTPPGSALERGAQLLEEVDVALVSNPEDDRALARGRGPRRMDFPQRSSGDYIGELIGEARRRAGFGYDADVELARRTHAAARRQTYFERADDGWQQMLPYRRLTEFRAALDPANEAARARLRDEVIRAVSQYEGMRRERVSGGELWLATGETRKGDVATFRRFAAAELMVRIARVEAPYVETEPDRLELVHVPSGTVLDMGLDLVEVLELLGEGYEPTADESSGFLMSLELFKHRLLAEPARELVLATQDELVRVAVGDIPGTVALETRVS